jgi:hypothetical protein
LIAAERSTAIGLTDEAFGLALRDSNPTIMGYLHLLQVVVHFSSGGLADAEKHVAAGLEFFDDPIFRWDPDGCAITVLGWAGF